MKIGIVGYGSIGRRHAANATKLGHNTLVYDPASRRDVKLERHIYDECDAVVIATPSPFHEGPLRACIERGKHALVEKPISTSIGMLPQLLKAAEEKGLVIMMGNNLRFHPCVQEAKRWIDADYIGPPIWAQFTCATLTEKLLYLSDGVILNTGSHEVDMAQNLLGPARVLCASARNISVGPGTSNISNVFTVNEYISDFVLEHENGCRSSFHLDFVTSREIREFRIVGDTGQSYCNLPHRRLWRLQHDEKLMGVTYDENYVGAGSYDDDYLAEMAAFIDRIEGKPAIGASGQDGLETLSLLLDVRKKAGL